MKNTRNSTILDSVVYGIVMFIANVVGTVAIVFFLMILNAVIGQEAANRHYVIFILLTALIAAAVVWLGSSFYFKYKIPDICKGETNQTILRSNFLFIVLPAEILRFILCCLPTMPRKMRQYLSCWRRASFLSPLRDVSSMGYSFVM